VPKYARRESTFFRELKKQDVCEDEMQQQNDCGEQEKLGRCGEVDGTMIQPCNTPLKSQHLTEDETGHPAANAAAAADDDDDVTEFTSLQSCTSLTSLCVSLSVSITSHVTMQQSSLLTDNFHSVMIF